MPVPHDRQTVIARRLHKDDVHETLLAAIVAGVLPEGSRLRDSDLESWLGVSRTPIRAALVRLEHIGLVEAVPQCWTRVAVARPDVVPALVVALCALWRDLVVEGQGALAPEAAGGVRRALARCAAPLDAYRADPAPDADRCRALVDQVFACVALLRGGDVPDVVRGALDGLESRLRHQAALLGRHLDADLVGAVLDEADAAVAAGDALRLRGAVDELARRTASRCSGPTPASDPWWRS
ncbi:GntR family transcriptional regulator [Frigoribacterium sp. ACAM 257]|uniref:GntR family transcriptional regulator n=1 Tax=Frigoribacterium sp. ACAM 257 TaxID=2508998 RepID=UPI00174D2739|nr:GntR family transcriptional regulator [Frigoribacterium sp. ACAM 257]